MDFEQRAFYALSCAAGTMCAMSAMGMMLVTNIPLAKASKKYLQASAVMLGYSAVDKFADTNSLLVDAIDLFPDGMVEIVNLKPAKKASLEGRNFIRRLALLPDRIHFTPCVLQDDKGKDGNALPR